MTGMDNRQISFNELLQGACQRSGTTAPAFRIARFWAVRCAPAHFRKTKLFGEVAVTIAMAIGAARTGRADPSSWGEQRKRLRCTCGRRSVQAPEATLSVVAIARPRF